MTHFINGKWVEGGGSALKTVSPVDGTQLYNRKEAEGPLVEKAILAAYVAFETWSTLPFDERIECLFRFKKLLTDEKEAFASVISQETGKPLWEARAELMSMIDKVRISERAYRQRCKILESGNGRTYFKAHGALAVLGPFNFPGHLPSGHIIPALLAGNTIVFKPSEKTPLTGKFYAHMMERAAFPPGVFNLVQGGKEVGLALAKSQHLSGLLFTGSYNVGLTLSKIFAGTPGKILALEMGGNNPLVIDEVRDLSTACYIAIQSAFLSSGQRCSCARRLIIQDGPFADNFLAELTEKTQRLKIGSPLESPEPYMGPLITLEARDQVLEAQKTLLAYGGTALLKAAAGQEAFITPGIIDVTAVSKRPDAEVFGPLLQVIRVKDFEEALSEANNTRFGLTAAIVTEKRALFERFQKKVKAGIVNWNAPTTGASSKGAFGGLKESGNHRASAFFAADYCSSPIACVEVETLKLPEKLPPGMEG